MIQPFFFKKNIILKIISYILTYCEVSFFSLKSLIKCDFFFQKALLSILLLIVTITEIVSDLEHYLFVNICLNNE